MNVIFGRKAVSEALRNEELEIEKIYIQYGTHGELLGKLKSIAQRRHIQVGYLGKKEFSNLVNKYCPGANTQGIVATLSEIKSLTLDELIEQAFERTEKPILVLADRIEDPQNLGAIARSVECAGANGLILTTKNSAPITSSTIKTSAGAILQLPIAKITSVQQTIETLKRKNFWLIGTSDKAERLYTEKIYDAPIVVIFGNEGKGLSQAVLKNCDFLVKIPMYGLIESLNVSVAAGVILFEIRRQREMSGRY
jgi:23S rRNA (guanosine2251-2'-O)-methyltransferase